MHIHVLKTDASLQRNITHLTSRRAGADPWRRNRGTWGRAGLGGYRGLLAAVLGWGLTLSHPRGCLSWLWFDPLGSCLVPPDPRGYLTGAIGRLADLGRHLLSTLFTVLLLYNSSGISLHLLKEARIQWNHARSTMRAIKFVLQV